VTGNYGPLVGIICGSDLSGLGNALQNTIVVPFSDIPNFPQTKKTVLGYKNEFIFGEIVCPSTGATVPAACVRGRFHLYEGFDMPTVALPVRVMRCLGVKALIVTSASGGLNSEYNVGDIVCMSDHFALPCMVGMNPLMGKNDDALGPRFPTSNAYDKEMRKIFIESSSQLGFENFVRDEGTYCFVSGPMHESKTEAKFLANFGDAVGMSTIPEVLAAHHAGMKVLFATLITNKVIMSNEESEKNVNHKEVLVEVCKQSDTFQQLIEVTVHNISGYLTSLPDLYPIDLDEVSDSEMSGKNKVSPTGLSSISLAWKIPAYCFSLAVGLVILDVVLGIPEKLSSFRSRK